MPLTEMTEILAAKSPRRKGSSGLKITLKPFERIEIGGLTLVNGWTESSTFSIEVTLMSSRTMAASLSTYPWSGP